MNSSSDESSKQIPQKINECPLNHNFHKLNSNSNYYNSNSQSEWSDVQSQVEKQNDLTLNPIITDQALNGKVAVNSFKKLFLENKCATKCIFSFHKLIIMDI